MTILIAYDGSEDARTAIEYAARTVKQEGERAVLLTVWEPLLTQMAWAPLAIPVPAGDPDSERYEEENEAHKLAAQGVELARKAGWADVTARAERNNGPIWSTIVDVAEELDASLIVIGSRGLSGAKSMLVGSVSNRVLHHAHRATLVVPPVRKE
ncbi:universal stress protein [Actinomadura parmotrematis]|uniref:Universal stress protein n=1 Tax=Actinomadura parmotrematis TaxID=2864039 RepID=A0ABS7FY59_9ACTN|nr:universal stress protein [Actinomadura parmotrematis]MBW8485377.1 universal stress protein [Actinomadura parmotrematis]